MKKRKREKSNRKTNPPMITSAKKYTKKKEMTDNTLGEMVNLNLYRQNHTQKHTRTHSQKEKKGKKYKYRCSLSPPLQFGMIHCLFRYSTDAGYIKLIVEI